MPPVLGRTPCGLERPRRVSDAAPDAPLRPASATAASALPVPAGRWVWYWEVPAEGYAPLVGVCVQLLPSRK